MVSLKKLTDAAGGAMKSLNLLIAPAIYLNLKYPLQTVDDTFKKRRDA
jgi:hypothetical protein